MWDAASGWERVGEFACTGLAMKSSLLLDGPSLSLKFPTTTLPKLGTKTLPPRQLDKDMQLECMLERGAGHFVAPSPATAGHAVGVHVGAVLGTSWRSRPPAAGARGSAGGSPGGVGPAASYSA